MNDRLREIALRRRQLVALAAEQRGDLAAQAVSLRRSLDWVDLLRRGGNALRSRPLAAGVAAAALMVVGPRRLLRLVYRSGLLLPIALRLVRIARALR
ncbi:MAG TPA: YqjK family protein [Burkholderiales bacterium]|jgi:hypothetical protein|nr:YqjK family protein [Burkholderiales bacterium]